VIVDSGILGRARPAPGGGLIVPARIGRAGVQEYKRPDGTTVRVYRPFEEVFAADFTGAPVTIGHPVGGVSSRTWREHARGLVTAQAKEPVVVDGQQWAAADLQLSDAEAQQLAQTGAECSCAYDCTREWSPGVTADGEQYDVIFRALKPNHVALGPVGFARAGRDARVLISDGEHMSDVLVDTFYAADSGGTPASAPAGDVPALAKLVADGAVEIARLKGEVETLTAKLAAADTQVAKLTADAAAAPPPADFEKRVADGVASELAFRARVAAHLPKDFDFAGKSRRDVQVAAIKAIDPKVEIADSVTEMWLDTYLEAAAKYAKPAVHDHNTDVDQAAPVTGAKSAYQHIADSTRDLWKGAK
jgi:hypothetical protein